MAKFVEVQTRAIEGTNNSIWMNMENVAAVVFSNGYAQFHTTGGETIKVSVFGTQSEFAAQFLQCKET